MLLLPDVLDAHQQELVRALEHDHEHKVAELASKLSPGLCARVMAEANPEAVVHGLREMPRRRAGQIIAAMPPELAAKLLRSLEPAEATKLLNRTSPDRVADLVAVAEKKDPTWTVALLAALDRPLREHATALVRYEPGTVGAVMKPTYLAVNQGTTVARTLETIHSVPAEIERTAYVFVVDGQRRPQGVMSMRDLLVAEPHKRVDEIMTSHVVAVRTSDTAASAARALRNRRFKMMPVLDEHDALVGVLAIEDAVAILAHNVADMFVEASGASPDESFYTPPLGAVRRRLPWMGANVFLNLGAVAVISSFESTIAQVAILAAFLPMITDMGGNVGIQALSVAIRSIALDEVRLRDFAKAVRKELIIGLVNGAALGTLFAGLAWLLEGNPWIGAVAGLALGVNVLVAGVVGGTMPFLIKRLGKDPAMMTGPILTTITDITGVSIYLGLCTLMLTQILG